MVSETVLLAGFVSLEFRQLKGTSIINTGTRHMRCFAGVYLQFSHKMEVAPMRMINQFVSDYLLSEGCSLVGFADLSAVPYAVEQGCPMGFVLLLRCRRSPA